jgi:tetratricopeptide (TPR) repeat protein
MNPVLEVLSRGLLSSLSGGFAALLQDPDPNPTVQELKHQARRDPNNPTPWVRLGTRFLRQYRVVPAKDCFERAAAIDDESAPARLGLACALDELGHTDQAIAHLLDVQRCDPFDAAVSFCLGFCYERLHSVSPALAHYTNSLRACPSLRNAHERLAAIWLYRRRLDKAIHHYRHLCELDPDAIDVRLFLASLLLQARRPEHAVEQFDLALLMEPDNWAGRDDAAAAYEEAGLFVEAVDQLHRLLQQESNRADTHLHLGDLYRKLGQDQTALHHYLQAVQVNPDYLEATVKVATSHLRADRHLEAARWFNRAVQLNDRLLIAYVGRALAQHEAGQSDAAATSLDMAASLEPNSILLFAEMLQLQRQAQPSPDLLLRPLHENPPSPQPEQAMTELLRQQIDRHRKMLRRNPNHADLHYRLGMLLRQQGLDDEAIEHYRQAVAIYPLYTPALIKLGLALTRQADRPEVIAVLQQAFHVPPDAAKLHYNLALLFCQRAHFELAVEHFEFVWGAKGQPADAHANLSLALQNMGLIDKAAATWQALCELCGTDVG